MNKIGFYANPGNRLKYPKEGNEGVMYNPEDPGSIHTGNWVL